MKKTYIIISAVSIGLLVGGGVFLWKQQQISQTSPDIAAQNPTPVPVQMATWKDQSGFSFAYPSDITVDKHEEDQENYAHVEMKSGSHKGAMIVWVKDVPVGVTDAASWVKKEKTFTGATVSDTTLGGKPAKRISFADKKKEIIGTVFDDVLWYIELAPADEAYWTPVFNGAVESFAFIPVSDTSGSTGAAVTGEESADDVAVDEEEVLE